MKASFNKKLATLAKRHAELTALLSEAETIADQERFRAYSKEYAQLDPVVACYNAYLQTQADKEASAALIDEQDADMRALAQEECQLLQDRQDALELELQQLLLPVDPDDQSNVYLEIRAGTGGDEAALFVGDLFRMYSRYAELCRWQVEVVSSSDGDHGGYKEIVILITGQNVYSKLKFESGAHRVQRVPETESQGRIHTSACTVAVLPKVEQISEVNINTADLKIDTFRASGAGGQHVNKTDSAIRITHQPSGLVVECQDERSQHKNRAKAMGLLQSKLLAKEREAQRQAETQTRRNLVGSGDRSERIRTYNFPQGRLTDHRINLTLYQLNDILEGQLDPVITPLIQEHQADLLAQLGENG